MRHEPTPPKTRAQLRIRGLAPALAIFGCILALILTPGCRGGTTPRPVVEQGAEEDLKLPSIQQGTPRPGRRVRVVAPEYRGTGVHHLLYLPTDWNPRSLYPVIVEYAGNGPYRNKLGDTCSGEISGSKIGYGVSGGRGAIWVCLPFVSADGRHNERLWWGDLQRTVAYCKTVIPRVCARFGGDPKRIVLAGFSRGAIACNYVGLHDDEIAQLWCGFICHSHYDGVRRWGYADSDRNAARQRLARLGSRPQWISHEESVEDTKAYLRASAPSGRFVFRELPFPNHTDTWVLKAGEERAALRQFFRSLVE